MFLLFVTVTDAFSEIDENFSSKATINATDQSLKERSPKLKSITNQKIHKKWDVFFILKYRILAVLTKIILVIKNLHCDNFTFGSMIEHPHCSNMSLPIRSSIFSMYN